MKWQQSLQSVFQITTDLDDENMHLIKISETYMNVTDYDMDLPQLPPRWGTFSKWMLYLETQIYTCKNGHLNI